MNQIREDFGRGLYLVDQSRALAGGHESSLGIGLFARPSLVSHYAVALRNLRLHREGLDLRWIALPLGGVCRPEHAARLAGIASRTHRRVVARSDDRITVFLRCLGFRGRDEP